MPSLVLKITRIIAFVLLSSSLLFPWLRVPNGVTQAAGKYTVGFIEPISTLAFKGVVLSVLLFLCALTRRQRRLSTPSPRINPCCVGGVVLFMAIVILYPALTMQRCAGVAAHASWLEAQNYSLVQPDADAFNAQEYFYESGQPAVGLKEVLPRSFNSMPAPILYSFSDLHLARIEDCVNWLGLSQAFCEFVRRGWFCGIFGSFLLAASFAHSRNTGSASLSARRGYPVFRLISIAGAGFLYLLCLSPVVIAGRELAKAQRATLEGNYHQALDHLDAAKRWLPAFAYDTDLICQSGWLERKLGFNSPNVQVFSAIREEEESFDVPSRPAFYPVT